MILLTQRKGDECDFLTNLVTLFLEPVHISAMSPNFREKIKGLSDSFLLTINKWKLEIQ